MNVRKLTRLVGFLAAVAAFGAGVVGVTNAGAEVDPSETFAGDVRPDTAIWD